ncbi:hypothetical protein T484DRAFT_1795901 [Baffinella frigidus]|nr:hypothetical protein T484DRAFT_1795901 [Cryptophyta sp. CCMP2293]
MSTSERFADLEDVGLGSEAVWRTTEIRQTKPAWAAFRDSRLISDQDAQLLIRFQREPVHTQGAFVSEDSAAFTHAFVGVLKSVSDVTAVLFILTTVDELMKENK